MAGAGENEGAPPPPVDRHALDEAAVGKRSRSEHHHGVADAPSSPPSFRMEDLPAEVQPVIISLLPLEEAVRTSIVSTSWRMLWRFHFNLCFDGPNDQDYEDYDTDDDLADQRDADSTSDQSIYLYSPKIKRAKFIEFVNWVIQHHSGIGINKFSIRCGLHHEDYDHLDRWIGYAASSKAKIVDFNLNRIDAPWSVLHFPLEALNAQGSSFVEFLFLASVSIEPHPEICGFTILRRLVLDSVEIYGDFPGLLANCSALEDLEIIKCSRVATLSIPHNLDKLQHLLIDRTHVEMVEFHAADLAHFEYKGQEIPIVLHGCSNLEKATIMLEGSNGLARVFTVVPIILPVKILNVQAHISEYEQLHKLPTRPLGLFMHLRHMTCQISVNCGGLNYDNGVLQLAHCLDTAPQLETLCLHMFYVISTSLSSGELVAGMRRHDYLKSVFMSGFRCHNAQIELACSILRNASVLEQLTIEPRVSDAVWGDDCYLCNRDLETFLPGVCEWAHLTSKRFSKVIMVLGGPLHNDTMEASLAGQDAGSLQHHH